MEEDHAELLDRSDRAPYEGEHRLDTGGSSVEISSSVKLFSLCACFNSCTVGYDQGAAVHCGRLIQGELGLSNLERGMFMTILFVFMIIGALGSPLISDRVGRRAALACSSYIYLMGAVMMTFASSFWAILFGRAVSGLGAGLGFSVDSMYIAEMAPAAHRGALVTWSYIGLTLGLMMGASTGLIFSSLEETIRWRVMLGIGMIFPIVVIITSVKVMKETPRFLIQAKRSKEARIALSMIYPLDYSVGAVLEGMREALLRDRMSQEGRGWSIILRPTRAFRRMLRLGWGISFVSQAVGVDAITYYMLDVMSDSGVEQTTMQCASLIGFTVIKLQCIAISSRLLDRVGRRMVLFISLTGLTASLLMIGSSFYLSDVDQPVVAMVGLGLYMAFYGIGLGPVSQLLPVEVFATSIRAKALSISVIIGRGTAAIMSATLLVWSDAVSWPEVFFTLAGISSVSGLLLYCYLPETKGISLEGMTLYFAEVTNDSSLIEAEKKIREDDDKDRTGDGGGYQRRAQMDGGTRMLRV
ncbi:Polyol transporter [Seminavis robusta]|uniref:Hexose transporter 1 n=1 Tax=Seminavis robusta TaxID=568900 RepID=A0A9N8DJ19_9STRA|nr:Polyol transporter [Seminavis robusta]|eukprot:Sro109_g054690.1 Polyol transporter (527) ;mRNA; f:100094-101783